MGRPLKCGPSPARSKYICNVTSCHIEIVGYDIEKHYRRKCNEQLLKQLKKCKDPTICSRIEEKADPHTIWLFVNGFDWKNMPTYKRNHTKAKKFLPGGEDNNNSVSNSIIHHFHKKTTNVTSSSSMSTSTTMEEETNSECVDNVDELQEEDITNSEHVDHVESHSEVVEEVTVNSDLDNIDDVVVDVVDSTLTNVAGTIMEEDEDQYEGLKDYWEDQQVQAPPQQAQPQGEREIIQVR